MIKETLEKIVKKRLVEFARIRVDLKSEESKEKNDRAALNFISIVYCGSNKNIIGYYRFYNSCRKHYERE